MSKKLPKYVHITNAVAQKLQHVLDEIKPDKIALLVDENTSKFCRSLLLLDVDLTIEIKSGELNKNLDTCIDIWTELTNSAFTRKSLLINLGGGVIGDMGGFAASTYKRGIPFINIPTTLLSQVDASVGGKLGIDFNNYKNHIGVFNDPDAVLIDPVFLKTLPYRQLVSGYAEVVKHALIFDSDHWRQLNETPFEKLDWENIIPKSVEIKNEVVSSDPFESGRRKILNFGHTLGHAIESKLLNSPSPILHGEAVAVGMILESHLSLQLGRISEDEFDSITNHLKTRFALPDKLPSYHELESLLGQDKKNNNDTVSFSLIDAIGSCTYDDYVSHENLIHCLKAY